MSGCTPFAQWRSLQAVRPRFHTLAVIGFTGLKHCRTPGSRRDRKKVQAVLARSSFISDCCVPCSFKLFLQTTREMERKLGQSQITRKADLQVEKAVLGLHIFVDHTSFLFLPLHPSIFERLKVVR